MLEQKHIIVFTTAYNAEKTLRKSINSILNQKHTNFTYYLLNNGSADNTGKIIKQYAEQDERIVPLFYEQNITEGLIPNVIKSIQKNCNKESYFCMLDADDQYNPDFFDKMLLFINQNNLDIAIGGSDFLDAKAKKIVSKRQVHHDIILQNTDFNTYFYQYHQFMRTIWGKLFSINLFKQCCFDRMPNVSYGTDTLFTMEAFRHARRVGILSGTLHKYYISTKSVSYHFNEKRIYSDQILASETERYLYDKCGMVSQRNQEFLRYMYLSAVKDTTNVLFSSKESIEKKLQSLIIILQNKYTQDLVKWPNGGEQKADLISGLVQWVLAQKESYTTQVSLATEALAYLAACPNAIPTKYTVPQQFIFWANLRNHWKGETIPKDIDIQLASLLLTSELLKQNNIAFCVYFTDICVAVLQENFISALHQAQSALSGVKDVPGEYVLPLVVLIVNLAALLEEIDIFIYFKKLQIALLLDSGKIHESVEELADWDIILPEDIDFKELRKRIEQ